MNMFKEDLVVVSEFCSVLCFVAFEKQKTKKTLRTPGQMATLAFCLFCPFTQNATGLSLTPPAPKGDCCTCDTAFQIKNRGDFGGLLYFLILLFTIEWTVRIFTNVRNNYIFPHYT